MMEIIDISFDIGPVGHEVCPGLDEASHFANALGSLGESVIHGRR
jgi:hypothetical protein